MSSMRAWQPVPRRALARGGPRRRDSILAVRLLAGLALAGSIAWLGWTLVRPLPEAAPASMSPLAQLAAPPLAPAALDARHTTVAALSSDNIFAHQRKPWDAAAPAVAAETPAESAPESAPSRPGKPREKVARKRELPEDIRKSLEGLSLKQIYTRRDGELVARISYTKGAEPETSIPVLVSEEFKDASGSATWKVVAIDRVANRVTIERSGHRASLDVFTSEPGDLADDSPTTAALAPAPVAVEPGVPEVERRSREEIITELRGAKVAEADIAALIALLDEHPELVQAAVPGAEPPAPATGSGRAPPPGLEGVLRMMGQQQKKAADQGPAASVKAPN